MTLLTTLAVVFGVYAFCLVQNLGEAEARMISFTCMVICNLGLIFTNRSWTRSVLATLKFPNRALWWVTGGAVAFLVLVLGVPGLNALFKFGPLERSQVVIVVVASLASLLVAESVKLPWMRKIIGN